MTVAAACLLAVGASGAAAAGSPAPGVHIDPGSPVAKEYAIPLAQARSGPGSSGGQLFGKGITPARGTAPAPAVTPATATAAASATAAGTPASRHAHGRARPVPGATHAAAAAAPVSSPASLSSATRPPGGGAGIAWMVGIAALVLALGGLGGAALSRHSRRTSTRTS